MRRVRSGFYKKRRRNRNVKAVGLFISKKTKKLLSKDILTRNLVSDYFKKGKSSRSNTSNTKQYLRRDILEKQFSNPKKKLSYSKALKRRLISQRFRLAQLALFIVVGLWFSQLFVKPTFYLESVRIAGAQEINPDEIRTIADEHLDKRSMLMVKKSHIFFLNKSQLEEKIREQYSLASLSFDSHWPSKILSITIQEKVPVVFYNIEDTYFAIDTDGRVIRELSPEEPVESLPVVYQYSDVELPEVGSLAFESGVVTSIQELSEGLHKYPGLEVHSYRLKESEQKKIVLKDKYSQRKQLDAETVNDQDTSSEALLKQALDSIAQAQTNSEKVSELKDLIENIEVEKLEEERVEQLLQEQKEFSPDDDYRLLELEVYTKAGWTIRFGHELLENPEATKKYLDIFATLSRQVDLAGEVNEYIDLRFPNRIYYR